MCNLILWCQSLFVALPLRCTAITGWTEYTKMTLNDLSYKEDLTAECAGLAYKTRRCIFRDIHLVLSFDLCIEGRWAVEDAINLNCW